MSSSPHMYSPIRSWRRIGDGDPIELGPIQEGPPTDQKASSLVALRTLDPPSSEQLLGREHSDGFPWLPRSSGNRLSRLLDAHDSTQNWPVGVRTGLFLVAAILIFNSSVTLWASVSFPVSDGVGVLHVGPCEQIRDTGLALHILINVLSTLLLGVSSFCMQCLASPTREEVDSQHTQKRWLEIGVLSLRNLHSIDRRRVWLWLFLALSSFPIHLMFNSAVFVNLTANRYTVAAVSESFVNNGTWTLVDGDDAHIALIAEIQKNVSDYEFLDFPDCIRQYRVDFLSGRRNVVLVTNGTTTADNSLIGYMDWAYNVSQNSWVCGASVTDDMILVPEDLNDYDCTVEDALASLPVYFGDDDTTAQYCLSQRVPDECRLQFSLPIMFVVIGCNAVKLVCLLLTLMDRQATLITLGDAVSSFLEHEDPTTKGICTVGIKDIMAGHWPDFPQPTRWAYHREDFGWQAAGLRRWASSHAFALAACGALAILLYEGVNLTTTNPDLATWWGLGFGVVTSSSLVRWKAPPVGGTGLLKMVLLANLPQLLLSTLYLSYNQVYTCMSLADEWASYALRRRPLRTSRSGRRGLQRPARFLTLPWRYMLPLMAVSAGCHFLLSQGFFLVSVSVFKGDDGVDQQDSGALDPDESLLTVGFSVIALVILAIVVGLVVLGSFTAGFRRYARRGVPLAGPCSAAISAACHVSRFEDGWDTASRAVQWGVTGTEQGVGHLAFSSGPVSEPIAGRLYF